MGNKIMTERNANILIITLECSFGGTNPVGLTLLLLATIFGQLPDMTLYGWACMCHDDFFLLIPQLGILMVIYQLSAPAPFISYSWHNEGRGCCNAFLLDTLCLSKLKAVHETRWSIVSSYEKSTY